MLRTSELKRWFDEGMPGSNHCLNDIIAEHVLDIWQQLERLVQNCGDAPYGRDFEDRARVIYRHFDEPSLATLKAAADARYRAIAERASARLAAAMKLGPRLIADNGSAA